MKNDRERPTDYIEKDQNKNRQSPQDKTNQRPDKNKNIQDNPEQQNSG